MANKIAHIRSHIDAKCKFPIGIGKKDIWDWFGNHGCHLGGHPFSDTKYSPESMVAPETTPFQHFYFVHPTADFRYPIVAVMLKSEKERKGKIYDAMEIIPWDTTDELMVYIPIDPELVPEPDCSISVEDFLSGFGGQGCETWVAPTSSKRPRDEEVEECPDAKKLRKE